jgi:hypothetical protein
VLGLGALAPAARAQTVEWIQRVSTGPSPRLGHAMAYDSARGVTVLFGGNLAPGVFRSGETWEWNGNTNSWTERHPVLSPSPRYFHAMAYDSARGVTVLFGGDTHNDAPNGETWEWNGSDWALRCTCGPSPRLVHAMAYDSARRVTVLFGGNSGSPNFQANDETWEWDGETWTQRQPNTSPSARFYHAMAYDSAPGRHVTVLFGGSQTQNVGNRETWEWNGTDWILRANTGPSPRFFHKMAYDVARGLTVLFGGSTDNSDRLSDTWEWNGTGVGLWAQQPINGPSGRYEHAMAYDAARGVTVLFGGNIAIGGNVGNGETWVLGVPCLAPSFTVQPAATSTCSAGGGSFEVAAAGTSPLVYRWQRETSANSGVFINLSNGRTTSWDGGDGGAVVFGVTTRKLIITADIANGLRLSQAHAIRYRCVVTNECGTLPSSPAQLSLCPADFNCDSVVDFFDYLDFVAAFDTDDPSADFNGDQVVDFFDYLDFAAAFDAGCN